MSSRTTKPHSHSSHSHPQSQLSHSAKPHLSREALRKANHSLIERRRREKMNKAFEDLRGMVPGLGGGGVGGGGRGDGGGVLEKTVEHMRFLTTRLATLETVNITSQAVRASTSCVRTGNGGGTTSEEEGEEEGEQEGEGEEEDQLEEEGEEAGDAAPTPPRGGERPRKRRRLNDNDNDNDSAGGSSTRRNRNRNSGRLAGCSKNRLGTGPRRERERGYDRKSVGAVEHDPMDGSGSGRVKEEKESSDEEPLAGGTIARGGQCYRSELEIQQSWENEPSAGGRMTHARGSSASLSQLHSRSYSQAHGHGQGQAQYKQLQNSPHLSNLLNPSGVPAPLSLGPTAVGAGSVSTPASTTSSPRVAYLPTHPHSHFQPQPHCKDPTTTTLLISPTSSRTDSQATQDEEGSLSPGRLGKVRMGMGLGFGVRGAGGHAGGVGLGDVVVDGIRVPGSHLQAEAAISRKLEFLPPFPPPPQPHPLSSLAPSHPYRHAQTPTNGILKPRTVDDVFLPSSLTEMSPVSPFFFAHPHISGSGATLPLPIEPSPFLGPAVGINDGNGLGGLFEVDLMSLKRESSDESEKDRERERQQQQQQQRGIVRRQTVSSSISRGEEAVAGGSAPRKYHRNSFERAPRPLPSIDLGRSKSSKAESRVQGLAEEEAKVAANILLALSSPESMTPTPWQTASKANGSPPAGFSLDMRMEEVDGRSARPEEQQQQQIITPTLQADVTELVVEAASIEPEPESEERAVEAGDASHGRVAKNARDILNMGREGGFGFLKMDI